MTPARVADAWWTVQYGSAPRKEKAMGLCFHDYQLIQIDDRLAGDDLRGTLFHEFTHAACPWMTEDHVVVVEKAMLEALRVSKEREKGLREARKAPITLDVTPQK